MVIDLDSYIGRVEQVTSAVENSFGSLTEAQLNWKPSAKRWSIAECIDHLIVTNQSYFSEFGPVIKGNHRMGLWKRFNPFTNIIGRTMAKTLGPDRVKTYTTPRLFEPAKSTIDKGIVSRFAENQEELISYLKSFKSINDSVIINSPVSTVITLKLEDAIQVLVGHEERHLKQAMEVRTDHNFPDNE